MDTEFKTAQEKRPQGSRWPVRANLPEGFTMQKLILGYAYARNGNAHNPTPEVVFELYLNGKLVSSSSKKRALVEMAREMDEGVL